MGYGNMPQNWHGIDMHSFFFSHPALTTHLRRDVLVIYSTPCQEDHMVKEHIS